MAEQLVIKSPPSESRAALEEIGCTLAALPRRLRLVLESIAHRSSAPTVREIESLWPSRRSFYRSWTEAIDDPPSTFLRRMRVLHALRLLDDGIAPKEAATRAGFSSPNQMRKHIAAKRERR